MRVRNWYTGLLVTEGMMDTAFSDVQNAIWKASGDKGFSGVITGHKVGQDSPLSMNVVVSGGTSYTNEGKRCFNVGDTVVDCSVDRDSISTAVVASGKSKIISVYAVFDRTLVTPEYDVTNTLIFTIEEEAITFEVVQGTEVTLPTAPTPPSLRTDAVLLADITLIYGQSTIVDADISIARREDFTVFIRSDLAATRYAFGTYTEAMQQIVDLLDDHVNGNADYHVWGNIICPITGGLVWANGTAYVPSSPTTLNVAIETYIVEALATSATNPSGAHLLGCFQSTYQSPTIPTLASGTLHARLESMRDATNVYMPALGSWPSGDNATNPADSVLDSVTKVVANLAARASATDQGIRRIGLHGTSFTLASWVALGASSTLYAVLAGLNSTTGTDGAAYVGAKASGALTVGTVRSQLDELDTRTNRSRETTQVTVGGGVASVTVTKFSYRIGGVGGGDIAVSAPSSDMGPTPVVHFALVDASGDNVNMQYLGSTIATFTGGTDPHIPGNGIKTWMELQWTGATWITRSWGHQVAVTVQ